MNLLDEHGHLLHLFNHFKYFGNHKSYVNEFLQGNTPRCQILIWGCKVKIQTLQLLLQTYKHFNYCIDRGEFPNELRHAELKEKCIRKTVNVTKKTIDL